MGSHDAANGSSAEGGLTPGTVLAGKYEIVRRLGSGGMGTVYEARHVSLRHAVAAKVIRSDLRAHPTLRLRFVEEGRIQAELRHPNLVEVYEVLDVGELLALIMELVAGQTLDAFIYDSQHPVDQAQGVDIACQILAGLARVHQRGVVHRDIKPENVFLSQERTRLIPKLSDFGVARDPAALGLTATGSVLGTVYYMSPEQIVDPRGADARSDLYSVGVTLFELFTKRVPFDGDSQYQLMKAHLEESVPRPRRIRPSLHPAIEAVILTALEKDPADRFQTASEMAEALGAALPQSQGQLDSAPVAPSSRRAAAGEPISAEAIGAERSNAQDRPAREVDARGPQPASLGSTGAGRVEEISPFEVPAVTHRPAPRPGWSTQRSSSYRLRSWSRACLLLALPILVYQLVPLGHCLYEVTDAYQLGSANAPDFNPTGYTWLTAPVAYEAAESEGLTSALSLGWGVCRERAGFGHDHPPVFNVALVLLLSAFLFFWLLGRLRGG